MLYAILAIAGYLVGSFPTGVVLTRRKYGIDVREMGSGNIGATNVTRVFGWYAGALVFVIDFFKGCLPLVAVQHYFPDAPWLLTSTATALVLGLCFSAYLGFRGGKGVATSFGCLAVVSPWLAFFSGVSYLALLVVTRISAVGSLGGIAVAWLTLAVSQPPVHLVVLVLLISFVVIVRHQTNIRRLVDTARARSGRDK